MPEARIQIYDYLQGQLVHEAGCPAGAALGLLLRIKHVRIGRRGQAEPAEIRRLSAGAPGPVFVHETTVLHGTCTIAQYLDERFPSPELQLQTPLERARERTWRTRLEIEGFAAVRTMRARRTPYERRAQARKRVTGQLQVLAPILARSRFLCGSRLTLADCYLYAIAAAAAEAGLGRPAPVEAHAAHAEICAELGRNTPPRRSARLGR